MHALAPAARSAKPTKSAEPAGRAHLHRGKRAGHTPAVSMSKSSRLLGVSALVLLLACNRGAPRPQGKSAAVRAAEPPAQPLTPTRLLTLPESAYNTLLALDGDTVYVLTRTAAHRLRPGKPPQTIELDLGNGPVLADSGIVFWSKGAIWNAAKDGSTVWRLAPLPDQPDYFVASGDGLAWFDRPKDGPYRISSLNRKKPRVLVTSDGEISAVHMVRDWVFFVQKAKDSSWRIGRIHVAGGEPAYTEPKSGPTPSMLTGTESILYYHMASSEIRELTPDLKSEHVWQRDFVCSPIHEAKNVFCARVEGFFEVLASSHKAKPLIFGRRDTITFIRANAKQVVWLVDAGADKLAVDMLPAAVLPVD